MKVIESQKQVIQYSARELHAGGVFGITKHHQLIKVGEKTETIQQVIARRALLHQTGVKHVGADPLFYGVNNGRNGPASMYWVKRSWSGMLKSANEQVKEFEFKDVDIHTKQQEEQALQDGADLFGEE